MIIVYLIRIILLPIVLLLEIFKTIIFWVKYGQDYQINRTLAEKNLQVEIREECKCTDIQETKVYMN